jgi:hypothetical protein
VIHKNELKENLITDIPFPVSEIKSYLWMGIINDFLHEEG